MKVRIKKIIEKYIFENKLTKNDFCKSCRISYSTLNKILKNNLNINLLSLLKITKKNRNQPFSNS